jgi:hypothetical protein
MRISIKAFFKFLWFVVIFLAIFSLGFDLLLPGSPPIVLAFPLALWAAYRISLRDRGNRLPAALNATSAGSSRDRLP